MVHFQVPLPGLARDITTLTRDEKDILGYFSTIDSSCISPVVDAYACIGLKGYGASLILTQIIKVMPPAWPVVMTCPDLHKCGSSRKMQHCFYNMQFTEFTFKIRNNPKIKDP